MALRAASPAPIVWMTAPAAIFLAVFFLLPMVRLFLTGAGGDAGWAAYVAVFTTPRYVAAFIATFGVAAATTSATLAISTVTGLFLVRNRFPGRSALVALLTLPLAFPGVVVGFMVIMLAGRLGLIGGLSKAMLGEKVVFAYSLTGLFMGYVYFSIPRVILTVMAAAEKLDPKLEEAARSLGASTFLVVRDVIVPGLMPAFVSAGAICFATAVGAFGTAFTLAARIDVLPMVIYTEFTLSANIAMAAALSFVLGVATWGVLALARSAAGSTVAAAA